MLGEQAGRGHAHEPLAGSGLTHLADRPLLQSQHLHGPAGQPQTTRCERESTSGAREELVVEFLAKLAAVQRHRRLRHAELRGGLLHRAKPDDSGERS